MLGPKQIAGIVLAGALLAAPALAPAQDSTSASVARTLVGLLDQQKLDAVAARGADGAFIGALYFPGSQLLVVQGRFADPERQIILLGSRSYRDIYVDLNSASDPGTRVFVSDLGADGLGYRPKRNEPFDTVDVGAASHAFDGDWKKAGMSEDEYRMLYGDLDARYAQMLQALVNQLQKGS